MHLENLGRVSTTGEWFPENYSVGGIDFELRTGDKFEIKGCGPVYMGRLIGEYTYPQVTAALMNRLIYVEGTGHNILGVNMFATYEQNNTPIGLLLEKVNEPSLP